MACEWAVDESCLPALPDEADPGYDAALAVREGAMSLAVQVLWALSGRQYGVCSYIARPCPNIPNWRYRYSQDYLYGPFVVIYDDVSGGWINSPCGCLGRCELTNPRTVHLPGPAVEITEVKIGGDVLPASQYALEGNTLYRRDVDWPTQNLSLPMGEEGTWTVEYLRGVPIPAGVDRLTGLLANEFMSACAGGKCRLPRSVTQVTRRGISYSVYDPGGLYAAGKTGLPEVDLWLSAVNPYRLLQPSTVI